MLHSIRLLSLLVVALLTYSTGAASAQEVRGTVTEIGLDAPLAGTLVTLLDADSAVSWRGSLPRRPSSG